MKLREILSRASELDEGDVVFVQRPWSLASEATVARFASHETVPRFLGQDCFEYFLEAPLIQDIKSQVSTSGGSEDEALAVLMYYAENDAYPD